jgi:hypothetical protein
VQNGNFLRSRSVALHNKGILERLIDFVLAIDPERRNMAFSSAVNRPVNFYFNMPQSSTARHS